MNIWVDADGCPVPVKEILFRAAERTQTRLWLLANHPMRVPPSPWIHFVQVPAGFDVADNEIVKRVSEGELVVSSDIPMAAEAIAKGAVVLSFRGEQYTIENIRSRLTMRDFMETLRSSGIQTGGPAAFGQQDKANFANALDRWLTSNRQG